MQHVTGMLDRGFDIKVIASHGDDAAWDSLGAYTDSLREKVFYYRPPQSRVNRVIGLFRIAFQNFLKGRLHYFRSWNFLRFGKNSLNLSLPYLYHKVLELGEAEIIHCHFGPVGVFGAHLKQLGATEKLVVTFHGFDVSRVLHESGDHHPYKSVFENADLILPISERWKSKLLEIGSPTEQTCVHHVGIDVSKFSFIGERAISDGLNILTTARFTEKKGLKYGIEAVAMVKKSHPHLKIRYHIIGDGPLWEEITALIKQLGLSQVVQLHGAQSHGYVHTILSKTDIFMLPSITAANGDQEGIPVAIMEAMACGLPVLSTIHSGIPELVEDGVSGCLVTECDSEALAEQIVFLASDSQIREKMGRSGRAKVLREFNIEQQNDWLEARYISLQD
jgi:colanic acid/amylovoran biosynthesis glycosyltransferase